VERLVGLGVPPTSIVLAHLDRNPDVDLHVELAAAGVFLEYDGPGRTKYHPDSTILALIAAMAERGHADRLLVGTDTARRSALRVAGGGPGLDYAVGRFRGRLSRTYGHALAAQLYVDNPARAFSFVPRD
jgi:phosphotriesterase-related protein